MNLEQQAIPYSRNGNHGKFLDMTSRQEKMDYIITNTMIR